MKIAQTGKIISQEARIKSSITHSGKNNYFYGKKHNEQTKEILSVAMQNRHKNGDFKNIQRTDGELLLNTVTGVYYYGFNEAAKTIGCNPGTLRIKVKMITPHGKKRPYPNNTDFIAA